MGFRVTIFRMNGFFLVLAVANAANPQVPSVVEGRGGGRLGRGRGAGGADVDRYHPAHEVTLELGP